MNKKFLLIIAIFLLSNSSAAYADSASEAYAEAVGSAKGGDIDFAFMNFRTITKDYPLSEYAKGALFAEGEYYFLNANYPDAKKAFSEFLTRYPATKNKIFALIYLLKSAQYVSDKEVAQDIEKQIITFTRLTLLFKKHKEYRYISPLSRKLLAVYSIDKIEFYAGDKLLAEISY